jgi:HK97 family phage major capsid protein
MIAELIEKRRRLWDENTAILQKSKADGRDVLNPDEEQEWQSRDAAIEALTKNIQMRQKQERLEAVLSEAETRTTAPDPLPQHAMAPNGRPSAAGMRQLRQSREDFELGLRGWFLTPTGQIRDTHRQSAQRIGIDLNAKILELNLATRAMQSLHPDHMREWEARAQTITTTGGGYTIPDEMMQALEKALLWFGPMRQTSRIIRTETGAPLPIPTVNDTNQVGAILDINTVVPMQDVTFGQLVLGAFKYTSKNVLVPIELMQDNAVNLPELLGELLGERIGRIQNTHFTTGAGTTLPFGITVQATSGSAPTGTVAGGFTYAHIVDMEHSVDIAYRRQGAAWMMHDAVVARLKKLVDTTGRPIWQPNDSAGMAGSAPSTLLGYPVFTNNDMSTAQTNGTRAILFGALQKYLIRDVIGITLMRLDERYADFHQVAFLAFARADGNLLNAGTNPVKFMAYTT